MAETNDIEQIKANVRAEVTREYEAQIFEAKLNELTAQYGFSQMDQKKISNVLDTSAFMIEGLLDVEKLTDFLQTITDPPTQPEATVKTSKQKGADLAEKFGITNNKKTTIETTDNTTAPDSKAQGAALADTYLGK